MGQGKGSGGNVVKLLVLLLLLLGLLGWNYKRNLEIEDTRPRPYRSYSDADLAMLAEAYEEQVAALERRYASASGSRTGARDTQGVAEAVAEFRRVQRASRAVRELGAQLSQEQASLDQIHEEQELRSELGAGFTRHVRRALRF